MIRVRKVRDEVCMWMPLLNEITEAEALRRQTLCPNVVIGPGGYVARPKLERGLFKEVAWEDLQLRSPHTLIGQGWAKMSRDAEIPLLPCAICTPRISLLSPSLLLHMYICIYIDIYIAIYIYMYTMYTQAFIHVCARASAAS